LGNEHNEYRDRAWGDTMGAFVKQTDPFHRLTSAHAYAEFLYSKAAWADFIITQQYGEPLAVHDWVLRYRSVPKPYIDEEYGYEGERDQPGHNQSTDRIRRTHWSIAMAGGYATYGDDAGELLYFDDGAIAPGIGIAAQALFQRTAKLPRVDIARPPAVIGKNTVHAIQSGLLYGYVGLVEGMVARFRAELGDGMKVIATGGLAELIRQETNVIEIHAPWLTLDGLRFIHEMNHPA